MVSTVAIQYTVHIVLFPEMDPVAVSRVVYMDRGFPLFWQSYANATCGYVVEWHDASCTWDCPVEWIKVAAGTVNASIESGMIPPLKRYQLYCFQYICALFCIKND